MSALLLLVRSLASYTLSRYNNKEDNDELTHQKRIVVAGIEDERTGVENEDAE